MSDEKRLVEITGEYWQRRDSLSERAAVEEMAKALRAAEQRAEKAENLAQRMKESYEAKVDDLARETLRASQAEQRAEEAEKAAELHRLHEEGARREIAMTAKVYGDERDTLAAQLAECRKALDTARREPYQLIWRVLGRVGITRTNGCPDNIMVEEFEQLRAERDDYRACFDYSRRLNKERSLPTAEYNEWIAAEARIEARWEKEETHE